MQKGQCMIQVDQIPV